MRGTPRACLHWADAAQGNKAYGHLLNMPTTAIEGGVSLRPLRLVSACVAGG